MDPDAILRAGFTPGSMSARDAASQVDGASAASTLSARLFVAECIEEGQIQHSSRNLQRLQHLCKDDPLDFALTNLMFDETELELNIGGGSWRSSLVSASIPWSDYILWSW